MEYTLSSSQINFYKTNYVIENNIWNQGFVQFFNKKYSYEQLSDAINHFIHTQDSTRIQLVEEDYSGKFIIADYEPVFFPFYKVNNKEEIHNISSTLINKPIEFNNLLFSGVIFELPEQSAIFVYAHHLISDGFSTHITASSIYKYLEESTHSNESYSFLEHIRKEEVYKTSKRFQRDLLYWKETLSQDITRCIYLQNHSTLDYKCNDLIFECPSDLFHKIKDFCSIQDCSLTSFFNALLSIYIYKTIGLTNFYIGNPLLNRTSQKDFATFGLYMHILPLVMHIKNIPFTDFICSIDDNLSDLFRHHGFTQQNIKNYIDDKSNGVFFDVVSDYQELPIHTQYETILKYSNNISTALELHWLNHSNQNLQLIIRYRTSIFNYQEINNMFSQIMTIADFCCVNPHVSIHEISLCSSKELNLIKKWSNGPNIAFPIDKTIYHLFEATCNKSPNKICVQDTNCQITFKEFKEKVEILDSIIRKHTANQKQTIAIIAERSIEMYVGIYAILRGGNAYVPISPQAPLDRINYILQDSMARIVLCQDSFNNRLQACDIINLNTQDNTIEPSYPVSAKCNDVAYVLYTSGSTGLPKGAMIKHSSVINRINWMNRAYPLGPEGVILQKTPYTFDVSVWELFWWGMFGGTLEILPPNDHLSPAKILDAIAHGNVTHIHFVPSVFQLFVQYLEKHPDERIKLSTVKHLFLSGEAAIANTINRFKTICPATIIHNLYGPTECTVDVTYFDCHETESDPIPIGKPIDNTCIYILDKDKCFVPIGIQGEIYIGGINVGNGYLNKPELTEERFISLPYSSLPFFKTGDIGYWNEDGQIIFCGRNDFQVKINGQRVELGEIENAILNIVGIENAAVFFENQNGRNYLYAFYSGAFYTEKSLKEFLKSSLPDYMIPSLFFHREHLALNSSGKINRKELAAEGNTLLKQQTETVEEPQTELESLICQSFGEILEINKVGRNTNFIEAGGTSLDIMRILSDYEFLHDLSAADFIKNPTPVKLAATITQKSIRIVKPLYHSEQEEKALFLFPYAGGDASAYINLVQEISSVSNNISLYYIDWISNDKVGDVISEIQQISKYSDIYFYSHCAGSSIAIKILSNMDHTVVKHFITGGNIPPKRKPKHLIHNPWQLVPDFVLLAILNKAGLNISGLNKTAIQKIANKFRINTTDYFNTMQQLQNKIDCPISAIINPNDLFTRNSSETIARWKEYTNETVTMNYINSDTHYFQQANAKDLLTQILSILD